MLKFLLLRVFRVCMAHEYDFGFSPALCLGNLVWEDLNNNGLKETAEKGLPGIELILYNPGVDGIKGNADDEEMGRDTTDAAGNYLFANLCSGDYYVKVNAEGRLSSTGEGPEMTGARTFEPAPDPDNDIDNQDDGIQMGAMIMSELITLTPNAEPINDADLDSNSNTTLDFGLFSLLSLGDKVWVDKNNNGIFDADEKGISNIEVILFQPGADGKRNTTDDVEIERKRTNLNGCYQFDNLLPGEYWVKLNRLPQGYVSSDGNGTLYTGSGSYEPGISPEINNDTDDNGEQMGTMIVSDLVKLVLYDEPVDDGDVLSSTNTTVDFGLFPLHQIMLFDPCNCLGNESAFDAGDGQFSDRIILLSTNPRTWTLKSASGLYSFNSPEPPNAPLPIALGTVAQADGKQDGYFRYILDVKHIDGVGYAACFTDGVNSLSVSNNCVANKDCKYDVNDDPDGTPVPKLDTCAQSFIMGVNGIPKADTLKCCDNKSTFADDGSKDGLYIDTVARTDVYTICAQNQWQYLTFNFSEFGLAQYDTLYVYDGKDNTAPLIDKFSGVGVSKTGGWVSSSCDPTINLSSCLTFELRTNGDNNKDVGWDGNFECKERDIKVKTNIENHKIPCDDIDGLAQVIIPAPEVSADCGTISPDMTLVVLNQNGDTCHNMVYTAPISDVALGNYGSGLYTAEWYVTLDPVKTTGKQPFSISLPALVCNDDVNIPLDSDCGLEVAPDDVLENPCEAPFFTYNVTVKFGFGKKTIITGSGSGSVSDWPEITKELIEEAGLDVCGGTAEVTIERIYTPTGADCDNGPTSEFCKTTVTFADQSAPFVSLSLAADTLIACDTTGLYKLLGPTVLDNCDDEATFDFSVTMAESAPCFGGNDTTEAYITYSATDACGNTSPSRVDTVVILRPKDFAVPSSAELECDGSDDGEDLGIPGVEIGYVENGDTTITDTIELSTEEYICGYILSKEVQPIPETDCGKKEFVTWRALDWCAPNARPTIIGTQFIEYTDTKAPTFVDTVEAGVAFPLEIELDHFDCTYDITKLAGPRATDNCTEESEIIVRLAGIYRIEDGEKWEIDYTDLECDSFCLRWVAEDACHEQTDYDEVDQIVVVKDVTKPGVVCIDQIHVSIGDEVAKIHYKDIDAGSYDACGIEKYELSRDGENWAEEVTVTCDDVHKSIKIYLRVTDAKGNQNTCWATIVSEDKIAPICSDLPDITQACDEAHVDNFGSSTDDDGDGEMEDSEWKDMTLEQADFYNQKFGYPVCSDNLSCGGLNFQQQYQLINWNCGTTNIKRRFRAIDWSNEGNISSWAEQKITIEYKANWTVSLPADWAGECADAIPDSDVQISSGTCDVMASEMEEQVFITQEDACLKVVRTFTIINWCKYDVNEPALVITRDENDHGFVAESRTIHAGDSINGTPLAEAGKIKYVQVLKIKDSKAPVITIETPDGCINEGCGALKTWTASAEDCSPEEGYVWTAKLYEAGVLVAEESSNTISYEVLAKEDYKAEFWVSDGCGNSSGAESPEQLFWDCKKPTPYCLHGVVVSLMPGGMIQVWATDLDHGSSDNCAPKDKLRFRIWHDALGAAPTTLAEVLALPENITFTCAYVGYQDVNIYVIDEEDNWDFCETYVLVQDNTKTCDGIEMPENMALISGTIASWNGNPVEKVQTQVFSAESRMNAMMTQEDGHYDFELPMYQDYTILPEKDILPLNGVSTYDLVLITKHILGISSFENPYQWIAADINRSGSITAYDMVELRKLILAIDKKFKNNTSWRFIEADYQFTTSNPLREAFPEVGEITNLSKNMEMDFVAVKIGDVNGNAQTNKLAGGEIRTTPAIFEINIDDIEVKAGMTYTANFSTRQLSQIQGYQFTLAYQDLKLEELTSKLAGIEHFGLHKLDENYLTTSWNYLTVQRDDKAAQINEVQDLFSIRFKALHSGKLSQQLSLLNQPTSIEAYDENGHIMEVHLKFETRNVSKTFELYQNQPNPFSQSTSIGFYLPEASEVTLSLKDEMGRLLKEIKENRRAGAQEFQLDDLDKLPKGIIYYQLSTKFGTKVSKMLRLD